jgi:hypothetical protein
MHNINYLYIKIYMNNKENKNKPTVNFKLFEENLTKESSYILGLLWADGHLMKKSKLTSINMSADDILEIKDIFLKTGNWRISPPFKKFFNNKEVKSQIKISSTTWGLYYILEKYNYLQKSSVSPDYLLNNMPQNLKKYWFRGYLDGDGCIRFKDKKYMSIVFAGPYNQNWNFLINLCKSLDIKFYIKKYEVKLGGYSQFVIYRKNDVRAFCNYIYEDFNDMGLKRKYEKFLEIDKYIIAKELNGWTNQKIRWLMKNYKILGGRQCAEYMGKSLESVYNKIRYLKKDNKLYVN